MICVPAAAAIIFGAGAADAIATSMTVIPPELWSHVTWSACSHTDIGCLFNAAQGDINQMFANGPCGSQDVFSLGTIDGTQGTKAGGDDEDDEEEDDDAV